MKDAAPAPAPEKPKTRTETKIKTVYTKVPMETKYYELPEDEIKKLKELERQMQADDLYAHQVSHAKNALESTIYTLRDKLDLSWKEFALPAESDKITSLLKETEGWLEDDECGEASKEEMTPN